MISLDRLPPPIVDIGTALMLVPTLLSGQFSLDEDVPEPMTLPVPVSVPYVHHKVRPWYAGGDKLVPQIMLVEDYWYRGMCIPAGFVSDGASIPRIFWRLWTPFSPNHAIAALVHDWLYFTGRLPRKECDMVFREILGLTGNSSFKTRAMYGAVRVGGSGAYHDM